MYDKSVFKDRIYELRKEKGLSQAGLGEILKLSTQAISKWETGLSVPDIDGLIYLANYFDVTLDSMFAETNSFNNLLRCPICKEALNLRQEKDKVEYRCKRSHKFVVDEGVIYFGTREIKGEEWSMTYRNYEHYLLEAEAPIPDFYQRSDVSADELKWKEISIRKPKVILDIASGTGTGIKSILNRIDWPCTVILTDLSHRILKWNRRYFRENYNNPYVDIHFLSCDASNLPIQPNMVDCILSYGGFESMQDKMLDGFKESIRVLKPDGAVIYNRSIIDDHESENSKRWIELYLDIKESVIDPGKMIDIDEWIESCKKIGFHKTVYKKVYGEMKVPDTEVFPFENMILRWMAEYVCISTI